MAKKVKKEIVETSGTMVATTTIKKLAVEAKRLDAKIKAEKERLDEIKKILIQSMAIDEDNSYEYLVSADNQPLVEYIKVDSNVFDKKTFQADNPDVYESYMKPTSCMKLLLK